MEKSVKHRFLNSVLFTALFVPLGFFLLRDTIIAITGIMFESIGGKESFLYQINEDIARLIIAGLLILIMPLFFIIPDHHPAIIEKELFEKVQAVQRRFSLPTRKIREYPLKGKVYCGCCDHARNRAGRV